MKLFQSIGKIWTLSFFMFPLVSFTNEAQEPLKKYNFIVIFTDDLGYGDLSSFGNPSIVTPVLDRMAMEGQKWNDERQNPSVFSRL